MRYLILGALLGTLCLAAAAQEQTPTPLGEVTVSGAQQRIVLPAQPLRMWASDFKDFKGTYVLENGQTLYLSGFDRKMYAKLEGQEYAELVASAPTSFVALNQQMEMAFFPDTGPAKEVRLRMLVPREQASAGEPALMVTLIARR